MTEETGGLAWELSKENVQPVKSGRDVDCITAVLQPSKEDIDRMMKEKQVFEEQIIAGEDAEDPIRPWDSYLQWTIQNFPTGGNDLTLLNLLKKFIEKFKSDQYINDVRYVRAWLKLAEIMKDPLETFSFMNTEGIGRNCAEFYIAWADEYEKFGDMKRADRIYNDGDDRCAQPRELLQKRHMEFQLRFARGMLKNDNQLMNDDEQQQRVAFAQLQGRGKHQNAGTSRAGKSLQPLQSSNRGRDAWPNAQQSGGFEIYEDGSNEIVAMGEVGKWSSAPSGYASKENVQQAGPWKGTKVRQRHTRTHFPSVPALPACEFTVYEDDCQSPEIPMTPRKIASNIESILSEKKEIPLELNFSKVKSAIHEKPVHESNSQRSGYQVDKIYTIMGERQMEEVRAAFWRKRQKIKTKQAVIHMQQELEQEEARLDVERMKSMKEKMKKIKFERKLLAEEQSERQQILLDLETRLKRVKILGKSAKNEEEERMLQQEEEDITIQLKSVKRKIRRASMKLEGTENACANTTPATNEFAIYDENNAPPEECSALENEMKTIAAKQASSANNSLNHSKRSQPSPTVNTKEAMSEIDSWFQNPLDDMLSASSPCAQSEDDGGGDRAFKPVLQIEQACARQLAGDENREAFEIFTEDDQAQDRNMAQPLVQKKKGLTARPAVFAEENSAQTTSELKDGDKTRLCFDDDTVAGRHFAAKAHMASTPFCSKTEKLQDMTQINQLSHIQLEYTENLGLYTDRKEPLDNCAETFEPIASDVWSHSANSMYRTVEKDNAQIPMEAKHLSPITEVSNESEKSSVAVMTKSSIKYETGSEQPQAWASPAFHAGMIKPGDSFSPDVSLNCQLWGEVEDRAAERSERHSTCQVPCPTVAARREADIEENKQEIGGNFTGLNSTSVFSPQTGSPESKYSALHIVHDPWEQGLSNSIVERNGLVASDSEIEICYANGEKMAKIKKGLKLKLGGKSLVFGQLVGEGAFAKVYNVSFENGQNEHQVVKAQCPPCPWEVYAISHAKHRLRSIGMNDVADAIVDVNVAHFFVDGSLIAMPCLNGGTLLDLINARKGVERVKDVVATWIAYQVMQIVHGLHTIGIIHGDIKPDNFMVTPMNLMESSESLFQVAGIKLIDFGRAIDVTELPEGSAFTASNGTSAFMCVQMQKKQPWNYHTDLYGIAGTLHVVLFGSYMTIKQTKEGVWETTDRVKRWYDGVLWKDFFDTLLNFPTPTEEKPITVTDSPLPLLISKMKSYLKTGDIECVNSFFRKF